MGKLCITTDFGGQKELVEQFGGILVKPNDVKNLIEGFSSSKTLANKSPFEKPKGIMNAEVYGNHLVDVFNDSAWLIDD